MFFWRSSSVGWCERCPAAAQASLVLDLRRTPLLETVRKGGTSNAPSGHLARIRRPKRVEKYRFGGPEGYVAGASETFRTVSLGNSVNKVQNSSEIHRRVLSLMRRARVVRRGRQLMGKPPLAEVAGPQLI
jgi:hypothetical protein